MIFVYFLQKSHVPSHGYTRTFPTDAKTRFLDFKAENSTFADVRKSIKLG